MTDTPNTDVLSEARAREIAAYKMLCSRLQRDYETAEASDTCTLRAAVKFAIAFAKEATPPAINAAVPAGFVLTERKLDDECGCPEEMWDTPYGELHMHLSAGKASNACLDNGDEGERHIDLTTATADEARAAIFAWAAYPATAPKVASDTGAITPEWCLRMAELEAGQEIGAGALGHPLRIKCELPPAGWVCTREPGHDGPCAAVASDTGAGLREAGLAEAITNALYEDQDGWDREKHEEYFEYIGAIAARAALSTDATLSVRSNGEVLEQAARGKAHD